MKIKLLKDRDGDIWVQKPRRVGTNAEPRFVVPDVSDDETEERIRELYGPVKVFVVDTEEFR